MAGASDNTKPLLIIVPGAWHSPAHYTELITYMSKEGYEVICQRNPSCDSVDPNAHTAATDAAAIRELILAQIDEGRDVVVAMHSYGGCPGGASAKGLSKAERQAARKPGGVVGLIFICAFIAKEGDSLCGKLPGGVRVDWMVLHPDGQLFPWDPKGHFYADVESPLDSVAISLLRCQASLSTDTPSPPPAWSDAYFDGRRSYLLCTEDKAIPLVAQKAMIEDSGVKWHVGTFDCAHSPFLSHPEKLGKWIVKQMSIYENLP